MNDWIKNIAPLVGTALGGPLGGVAATFLADKLGLESKTVEAVTEVLNGGKMTPDQVTAIRLADFEFKKFLEVNKIKIEEIAAQDRDSARAMQIATRSWVPAAISLIVVFGYFAILVGLMFGVLHVTDNQSLLILIGALSTAFGGVLNFWLGSSHGSQVKSEMMANSAPMR